MTGLYRRMVKDMQLRGFSERTQETYLREVRKLCQHVDKSPGKIAEEELREYFLHLKNEHAFSAGSMKVAYCGVKFFFTFTLKKEWSTLALVRARKEVRLPVVLEVEEVRRIVGAADALHNRAFFCPRILLRSQAPGGAEAPGQRHRRGTHDAPRPPRSVRLLHRRLPGVAAARGRATATSPSRSRRSGVCAPTGRHTAIPCGSSPSSATPATRGRPPRVR